MEMDETNYTETNENTDEDSNYVPNSMLTLPPSMYNDNEQSHL